MTDHAIPKPKLALKPFERCVLLNGGGVVFVPISKWVCTGHGVSDISADTPEDAYRRWAESFRHLQDLRAAGEVP
jgi:hypothetical protein